MFWPTVITPKQKIMKMTTLHPATGPPNGVPGVNYPNSGKIDQNITIKTKPWTKV